MTAVVRMAVNTVVDSFRSLPRWAQRQAAATLMHEHQAVFNDLEIPAQAPLAKAKIPVPPVPPALVRTVGKERAAGPLVEDSTKGSTVSSRAKKPKGYLRPSVANLPFAIRLRDNPDGYEGKKTDQLLLSAALAALNRGLEAGATEEHITEALSTVRASKSTYAKLWPSDRTRRRWAEKLAAKTRRVPEAMTWEVGTKTLILTTHSATWEGSTEDEEMDTENPIWKLDVTSLPFHDNQGEELVASRETVKLFVRGVSGNYSRLNKFVYGLGQHVGLRWVNELLGILRWSEDGEEIHPQPSPVKRPKKRKSEEQAVNV